jgi:hypothetical protein
MAAMDCTEYFMRKIMTKERVLYGEKVSKESGIKGSRRV